MGISHIIAKVKLKNGTPGSFHTLDNRRIVIVQESPQSDASNNLVIVEKKLPMKPILVVERKLHDKPRRVQDIVNEFASKTILYCSDDLEDYVSIENGRFSPELTSPDDSYFCEQCEKHFKDNDKLLIHIFFHCQVPPNIVNQVRRELNWNQKSD